MFERVSTVSIFVTDYDAAIEFYTETLGFELRRNEPYGDSGQRWIEVAPQGAETSVVLYKPDENWAHYKQVIGESQALTFAVGDIHEVVKTLRERGAKIPQDPFETPNGIFAFVLDQDENRLILVA